MRIIEAGSSCQFREAFKLALQSLWGNKLRTILTLIGVVMGVASVIMVITLVNGANRYVGTKLSGYGADVFMFRGGGVIFSAQDYFRYQKRKIVRIEDYEAVRDNCAQCSEVGAISAQIYKCGLQRPFERQHGSARLHVEMLALTTSILRSGADLRPPTMSTPRTTRSWATTLWTTCWATGDPIGKEIRVDGIPYTIVGVGERQGKTLGQSQDNWVAVPHQHLSADQRVQRFDRHLCARGRRRRRPMEQAEDEVRVLMRTRRHDAPGTPDDFEIETNDTFLDIWKQISSLFASVVLGLASISLVVGGVVIMNIMLVSVTERTREIGVRKALGREAARCAAAVPD